MYNVYEYQLMPDPDNVFLKYSTYEDYLPDPGIFEAP